jgi:hypothetical protein
MKKMFNGYFYVKSKKINRSTVKYRGFVMAMDVMNSKDYLSFLNDIK